MAVLEDAIKKLAGLSPDQLAKQAAVIMAGTKGLNWIPNAGPQYQALISPADVLLFGGSAGSGKAITMETKIPTPDGFKTMGEIVIGDFVLSPNGSPVKVIAVSEVLTDADTYAVTFDSGEVIKCDGRHLWNTMTDEDRTRSLRLDPEWREDRKARRASRALSNPVNRGSQANVTKQNKNRAYTYLPQPVPTPKTTLEIMETLTVRKRTNHSISVCNAVNLPKADLPVDPYLFGLWLGDGFSRTGKIGMAEDDFHSILHHLPPTVSVSVERPPKRKTPYMSCVFQGLTSGLRSIDAIGNKHIPVCYLRASFEQRLALLQGMMDTDGTSSTNGAVSLGFSNETLINDARELVSSLGIKTAVTRKIPTINGKQYKTHYTLRFTTDLPVFRLKRKLDRMKESASRPSTKHRFITKIVPIGKFPMRCIQVENSDGLYLVGRTFITTHNSALILGLSFTQHQESLIMRRKYTDLEGLQRDAMRLFGTTSHLSGGARPKIKTDDGRLIEFGACQHTGDEESWQGVPHDGLFFDEVTHFTEHQFRFLQTWNRTAREGQRSRVVAASNPPTSADGDWVIGYWRPWLDPTHPNPAKPGELRWFVTTPDGKDMEVPDNTPYQFPGEAKPNHPKSRTFIPGKLDDNPYLTRDSSYKSTLDALPEPLRSAMRDGNFMLSREDDAYQVIPTAWVKQAMARWETHKPMGVPMCCIAADPAQGGKDQTTLAMRYDGWYDTLVAVPGEKTPLGTDVGALILKHRRNSCDIVIDMGGGYGSSAFDHLRGNEIKAFAYKGAEASPKKTLCGKIGFPNRRSEVWWKFREALDPSQAGGSPVCLPADAQLLADLTAPTFEYGTTGLKIEKKDDVKKRLGRSPDKGDAVVLAWSEGPKLLKPSHPAQFSGRRGPAPKVLMGHANRRR